MRIELQPSTLVARIEVDAVTDIAIPLPGSARGFSPARVTLDGSNAEAIARTEDGVLWLLIPAGTHQVLLEGSLPQVDSLEISLPLKPHRLEAASAGWTVEGIHEDGVAEGNIRLVRQAHVGQNSTALQPGELPPFVRVTRTIHLGLVWEADTTVGRMTASDTAITLQVPLKGLTFANKDGVQRAVVNVYGQLTKLSGQIVQTFEETLHRDIPAELLEKEINNVSLYWKALPMRPGLYRLDVVMKDVNGDKTGIFSRSYTVPDFGDEKLTSSTLILADQMEPVPAREVGTGNFVIGTNKVRPKVQSSDGKPASFKQKEKINFWLQVYNLGVDQKTNKPSATVEYQVVNTATNKHVLDFTESTAQMGNVGEQVTLGKSLQLSQLDPGVYQVTIKVNDQISKQTISPTAKFSVQQ